MEEIENPLSGKTTGIVLSCKISGELEKERRIFLPSASVDNLERFINGLKGKDYYCEFRKITDKKEEWWDPLGKSNTTLKPISTLGRKFKLPEEQKIVGD